MVAGSESSKFRACGSNIYDPNIEGFADGVFNFQTTSGALSHDNLGDHSQEVKAMNGYHKINLDASLSSSVYGASSTVQPAGLFAQCLIRYE